MGFHSRLICDEPSCCGQGIPIIESRLGLVPIESHIRVCWVKDFKNERCVEDIRKFLLWRVKATGDLLSPALLW